MNGILNWGKRGLSPLLVLVLLFAAIHPAAAVTVTAINGSSCAGTRSTANLGCTAGEFTAIVNITNAPGAPTSCVAGGYVFYNGTISLSGTNADRYDIGFFSGENGNDPALNNAINVCSVATFPTSPLPWKAKDTDACGDFSAAGLDTPAINSIRVLCAGDATGALMIPYTLVYSQNAGSVCNGPADVVGGSTSKCNKGIAIVPVATFTVNGSVTVTKKTVPAGDAQSFAFTASGTGPVMSGDTGFNLIDNGVTKQVRMGISGTNRTLTITETAADTNLWEPTATIACTLPDGITPAGFVATNGATRTITATLSNTNPNALCTLTNTRRTTTLATGTDPVAGIIIAPGAAATDVDLFTLQTSGGTETITSVTVNLSTSSGVGRLAITDNAGTELGFTTSPTTGSNTITVAGMSATTTSASTPFKVRITPLSHALMPVPPGATYTITAPVTAWAGPNIHTGTDTNPNALMIDNLSPAGATATSGSAGDAQVTLNWTNPADSDYSSAIVLRRATTAVADVPVEGATYAVGNTIGTATVACVVATPTATCTDMGLTNGTAYYYKIFTKDTNGNYDLGVVPTGAPFTPRVTTIADGTNPSNVTIAPSAAITDLDSFTLSTSAGTDSVTALTVTLTGANSFQSLSEVRITSNDGLTTYFAAAANPLSNTISFSGGTPIPVTTSATTFKVRITPKTHANMPVPPGLSYAVGGTVTAFTSTNGQAGTDSASATVTVDNLSPAGATAVSGSPGDMQVTLNWATSASTDFSRSVMLRWTGGTAGTEVPAEGTDYVNGNTITTATVVCVRTSDAVSTAVSDVDGAGTGGCSATALTSGQAYTYKIFQKDSNGNYDVGVSVGTVTTLPRVVSINLASCTSTAATVQWTVTFSRSVTGVDATAFSLVPTGLSGAYITTVSGGGASWTVTANTGIGAGSLGLNQTGPGSVVPTLNGTFIGAVCTITSTPALAEYRMDEASWNGTANEVADSSGSGNNAQSFNSANTDGTTPAIAGSCRYGVFDNGTTITQGYVQTPLPNLTTDFTVTAWIRTTNNTVANQRILIDDQNNTGGYGLSLADGATGKLRFYSRGITPANLDSTYTIANNTWYFVAAVADITNKKRTIYVFDTAGALLNSTTEAAWTGGAWGTDVGPVSIGAETNASAEIPANYHFRGNLDEVRVYQKVLNQNALAAIAAQTHACPVNIPDHLEIQSSGSGLTCAASTLTIKACTDAAIPCAVPYTLGVSGILSATGAPTVNWDGTTGGAAGAGFAIPNGGSSVTKDVQVVTAGSVVFGVSSAAPVPTSATACNFGTPACTFTASLAGFIFSDTTTGNSYTIPAQVSGIATPTLYLRAVQATTTNPAVCTPAIVGQTTPVNMGYVCNNPVACQAGNLATINATPIAPGGTSVSLTFDANGSAPITARYDDVGQITLNANKIVTPFGGGTATTLNGNSNAFVVKPHHFDLSAIQQTAAPNLVNPAAANAAGAKFVKAGEQFSVTVTARNFANAATPNYGQETTAESVKLTNALVTGLGLTNNPAISGTFGAFTGGVATGTNFTWDEAGIITLTPSILSGNYLGVAGDTTGTASGNVGRFYPDHFDVSLNVPVFGTACTGFSYAGQNFSYTTAPVITATARNFGGTTTTNYAGPNDGSSWWKITSASLTGKTYSQFPASPVLAAAPTAPDPAIVTNGNGTGTLTFNSGTGFSFARGSPISPFDADIALGINVIDADGVAYAANPASFGTATAGNGIAFSSGKTFRFGRLRMLNAYGSELLDIRLPVRVEYSTGPNSWSPNSLDNCTILPSSSIALGNYLPPPAGTAVSATNMGVAPTDHRPGSNTTLVGGSGTIVLAKPSPVASGSFDVVLNLGTGIVSPNSCVTTGTFGGGTAASLGYLLGNWCGSNHDRAPSARVKLGSPKAPYIYLRERY